MAAFNCRRPTATGRAIRRLAAWTIVVGVIVGAGTAAFSLVERHARSELAGLVDATAAAAPTETQR